MRYGAGILKWNKNELQEMDRKASKFMTMKKELHPRSDVARLYVSRENGGGELIGWENSVRSEENDCSFHVTRYGNSLISVFQGFFAIINKIYILAGSLKVVRQLVSQLLHTMFISNNHASFHLW